MMRAAALLAMAGGAAAAAPIVSVESRSGTYEVQGEFTTAAPIDTAWAVLTDYEHIPSFVNSIKRSAVLRGSGDSVRVQQSAVVGVFPFRFTARVTLAVTEEPMRRIEFIDTLGEDFFRYAGSWSLRGDSSSTVVHYSLLAIPRSNAPSWFGRGMTSHGIADLLLQVHREIDRRAARR
jgi:carbon monoxide dehydrogenase subunit G